MTQATTKLPPEKLEQIKTMALAGKSHRGIARVLDMSHSTVSAIVKNVLQIPPRPPVVKRVNTALARPIEPAKWSQIRERERVVPDNVPHITATMRGRYVPKELDYRGRVAR